MQLKDFRALSSMAAMMASTLTPTARTLAASATDLVVTDIAAFKLTGDIGGNALATFTGGVTGQSIVIEFINSLINISASLVNFKDGERFYGQAGDVLGIWFDGTSWHEEFRKRASKAPKALTLAASATALALVTVPLCDGVREVALTGDAGGNAVASITSLGSGELLIIRFIDALVNFTTAAAKFSNNAAYYPQAGDMIMLFNDGTNIRELGRVSASHAPTTVTLSGAATAIPVTTVPTIRGVKKIKLIGDGGGNSITSITGLSAGDTLEIVLSDALVTITTTAAKLENNASYKSAQDDVIVFTYDGTTVRQVSLQRQLGPIIATSSPANPTGTASATLVMMGLAGAFTPKLTGRVKITATGMIGNDTIGDGASVQLSYGTGAAPANGDAVTGTQVGSIKNAVASTAAGKQGFAACWIVTGRTIGTALWVDLALKAVTGGTASLYDIDLVIEEI